MTYPPRPDDKPFPPEKDRREGTRMDSNSGRIGGGPGGMPPLRRPSHDEVRWLRSRVEFLEGELATQGGEVFVIPSSPVKVKTTTFFDGVDLRGDDWPAGLRLFDSFDDVALYWRGPDGKPLCCISPVEDTGEWRLINEKHEGPSLFFDGLPQALLGVRGFLSDKEERR